MPQKSKLDDRHNRSAVLSALRRGLSMEAAAEHIGTTKRSLQRHCVRCADFGKAVEAARAVGERANDMTAGASEFSSDALADAPPSFDPVPNHGGPRPDSFVASEILGVDVDLVQDVDDSMPVVPGLPPINVKSFMALMWSRAHGVECSSPAVECMAIKVCDGVIMGPMLSAQKRRDAAASRIALAESVVDVETSPDMSDGDGLVVLEIPANGSEAPGHAPRPQDEADL